MYEIGVGGLADLQSILLDLFSQALAEVLEDPTDIGHIYFPFEETQIDEIVDSRVSVLMKRREDLVLVVAVEFEEEQIFEDTDVLFMAIVC